MKTWQRTARGAVIALAIGAGRDVAAREPVTAEPDIPRLIVELDSPVYATRVNATRLLSIAGAPAIDPLRDAAANGSLEAAARALKVLDAIYSGSGAPVDDDSLNRVEQALVSLTKSNQPSVASRASAVLDHNYEVTERLALIEIKKMNGRAIYDGAQQGGPRDEEGERQYAIAITSKWTGGDAGLAQIKRLSQLVTLYVIDGAPLSKEAIEELKAARPDLTVAERGRALLGIAGMPHPNGCQVNRVNENGAADKAGIRPGDVIIAFDDQPTPDFEALTKLIGQHKEGDTLDVHYYPGGRLDAEATAKVELGGWD